MLKNKMFAVLTALLVISSILLSACQPQATPTTTETAAASTAPAETQAPAASEVAAASGGELTIGISVEPQTLDAGAGFYQDEQFIMMNLFDTLMTIDPQNKIYPGLALSAEPNADFTDFTFILREDVKFHDGTAFNAEAVKATFDHIFNDVTSSTAKNMLANYSESVVNGDYSVTVKFSQPYPTFLNDVSRPWLGISSPTALAQSGAEYGRKPVGTGPFMLEEWAAQEKIVLVRNPDYNWGAEFAGHQGPALLDKVIFRILPDAATRLTAYQTGEVSLVEEPPALDAISLADANEGILQTFAAPGMVSHMMINTEKAPTNDLTVRQAMIYAVNQEELAQTAFNRVGVAAHNVLSPTTWSYNEEAAALYSYDPEKAAQLLDDAGWVDANGDGIREKDGENLHLVYLAIPAYEEAFMELLAGYLTKAGFEVEIRTLDDAGVFAEGNAGNHNILNMGWTTLDPGIMRIVYDSENIQSGSAFTRFVNADLDNALADGSIQTDTEARKADYMLAQKIIMENALIIPVHCYNRVFLMNPAVSGFAFDVEGYPLVYDMALNQ